MELIVKEQKCCSPTVIFTCIVWGKMMVLQNLLPMMD